MSKTAKQGKPLVPTSNYVSHYDPAKSHHRAWLQAVLDRLVALDPTALAEGVIGRRPRVEQSEQGPQVTLSPALAGEGLQLLAHHLLQLRPRAALQQCRQQRIELTEQRRSHRQDATLHKPPGQRLHQGLDDPQGKEGEGQIKQPAHRPRPRRCWSGTDRGDCAGAGDAPQAPACRHRGRHHQGPVPWGLGHRDGRSP